MEDFGPWERKEEKLLQILSVGHPDDVMYVYWVSEGKRITPAILKSPPFDDLYEFLRDEFGAYTYDIMIRRGKKMILTHQIIFATPLNHTARKDIRLEIEKLRRKKKRELVEHI